MPVHTPAKKAAAKRKSAAKPKSVAKDKAKSKPKAQKQNKKKLASVGAFSKPRNIRKGKTNGTKGKA